MRSAGWVAPSLPAGQPRSGGALGRAFDRGGCADDRGGAGGARRAAAAVAAGYFDEQILPIEVPAKRGTTVTMKTDEHIRPDASAAGMAKLRPAFAKDGTVTAGNASGMNDAAAAVVLASGAYAGSHGLQPLGRLVAYSHAGVEPRIMGTGPVPAIRKVLDRSGMKVDEIDVFEVNQAFAARALAVSARLACRWTGPTRTAAASGWGTRWAPPVPSLW
jgi:acetyl-CoA C-acetyltransferase